MLALRLLDRVERETGLRPPVLDLFEAPTLAGMARRLREHARRSSCLVPLRPGSQPPLFLVHAASGQALRYQALAERLGDGTAVYGLRAPDLDGDGASPSRIEHLAARHVR